MEIWLERGCHFPDFDPRLISGLSLDPRQACKEVGLVKIDLPRICVLDPEISKSS